MEGDKTMRHRGLGNSGKKCSLGMEECKLLSLMALLFWKIDGSCAIVPILQRRKMRNSGLVRSPVNLQQSWILNPVLLAPSPGLFLQRLG